MATHSLHSFQWPLIFTVLGIAGLWFMRIEPALHGIPLDFEQHVQDARLSDGSELRTTYTGIAAVDQVLSFLVLAFADGAFGANPAVKLHHLHFFLNFFSVLCILNVEAYRERNASRVVRFPGIWAFLYQTIAGAMVIPLYYAAWFFPSSPSPSSPTKDKEAIIVPLAKAKAILPSAIILYLIPTLAMYLLQAETATTAWTKQGIIAYWQISPIAASAAIPFFSHLVSSRDPKHLSAEHYLARIYTVAFGLSALAHLYVLFVCYMASSPSSSSNMHDEGLALSLYHVFIPDRSLWRESLTSGLHYIFQCDWWVVYGASLLWSGIVATDVQRNAADKAVVVVPGQETNSPSKARLLATNLAKIVGLAALFGPGAALAAVWWWKENAERETVQKVRTA